MELVSLERLPRGLGTTLALACVQITPHVRANGIRLVDAGNGALRVYSPNSGSRSVLSFSPAAIAELKNLITEAYESATANDRDSD